MNYFLGRDPAWLETQLKLAQADLAAGKTVIGANGADIGSTKQVQENARERIKLLLQALRKADPGSPLWTDDIYPITETRAVFDGGYCG